MLPAPFIGDLWLADTTDVVMSAPLLGLMVSPTSGAHPQPSDRHTQQEQGGDVVLDPCARMIALAWQAGWALHVLH